MTENKPEWADDPDDDEAPVDEIVLEPDDDVDDGELETVAMTTPVDASVETPEGDDR